MNFDIPILFIVFNRPETTKKVFEQIRNVRPTKLYIVSDGSRDNRIGESELVSETRQIFDSIDWECQIFKRYRDNNWGCGQSVADGITWFFEIEEMGIILEDDCVPSFSFFNFSKELLIRYKDDSRIMHISGSRYNEERQRNNDSYLFSRYAHISGWATWRRAWKLFDLNINDWDICKKETWLCDMFPNKTEQKFWYRRFQSIYEAGEKKHAWGYQWQYCVNKNNSLCITPKVNLISNIGIEGVHTIAAQPFNNRKVDDNFVIISHPIFFIKNKWFDDYHFKNHFNKKPWLFIRIIRRLKRYFHK